jgi:ADP-ribose pyrophosphatase YjhB (NUDIX family)
MMRRAGSKVVAGWCHGPRIGRSWRHRIGLKPLRAYEDFADTGAPPAPLERTHRLVYRLAFLGLRLWWFLRRPRTRGAVVVVHDGTEVLVVRTSYRPGYTLPGGGVGRGETARAAAVRELFEETGIVVAPEALRPIGTVTAPENHRTIETTLFAWRPAPLPRPRADRREVVWAGYLPIAALAGEILTPGLREVVARYATAAPTGGVPAVQDKGMP